MKKRILVTGGAGFIGRHLVKRLLSDGPHDYIRVVDNLATGNPGLEPALPGSVSFRTGDVVHLRSMTVPEIHWDEIYHLACPASPRAYQLDPRGTLVTAFVGTLEALLLAERADSKLLVASTSETYGDPDVTPQHESYHGRVSFTGPRACYDEGKRAAETLIADAVRAGNGKLRVARIFNTYGPGMAIDDGRVVSNFVAQAIRGRPLTLYGDGAQTRSFCYVDDTVDGLVQLMASEASSPVNIGNPTERSMLDLARAVLRAVGDEAHVMERVEFFPLPKDDPRRRCPDISRAREILGWEPAVALEEGIARTVFDFKRRLT